MSDHHATPELYTIHDKFMVKFTDGWHEGHITKIRMGSSVEYRLYFKHVDMKIPCTHSELVKNHLDTIIAI